MELTQQITAQTANSVQTTRKGRHFFGGGILLRGGGSSYGNPLPSIYHPARQRILYQLHTNPQNSLWQGASARIAQRVAGTSLEISGTGRVRYFQDIIMFGADRGNGLGSFLQKIISTFHWSDDGAVAEIIGRGHPREPLRREAITGLGVLDPLRCWFTGDPEFPVWYQDSVSGTFHELHHTRVHRFVPYPFTDPELNGRGFSSLSRALSYVQQQIVQQVYIGEKLHNQPTPGIVIVNGLTSDQWSDAYAAYAQQSTDGGLGVSKPIMEIIAPEGKTVTVEFQPFAEPPPNFDVLQMTELQARAIALGLDTDPQDVLPLSGGTWGANTQAKILDRKNRDGGFSYLLKMLERFYNTRVLPDNMTARWEYRDSEQSAEDAETAQRNIAMIRDAAGMLSEFNALSPEQIASIVTRAMADLVKPFAAYLTDDSGTVITYYDDDIAPVDVANSDPNAGVSPQLGAGVPTPQAPAPGQLPAPAVEAKAAEPYYVALDLSNNPDLIALQRQVMSFVGDSTEAEWNAPDSFHITLAYAPSVDETTRDALTAAVKSVPLPELSLGVGSLNSFDSVGKYALHFRVPRNGELIEYQAALYDAMTKAGAQLSAYSQPAQYKPHITMGYLKQRPPRQSFSSPLHITPERVTAAWGADDGSGHAPVIYRSDEETDALPVESKARRWKAFGTVSDEFATRFTTILNSANTGIIPARQRAGTLLRQQMRTYGRRAVVEGKLSGGVDEADLTKREQSWFLGFLSEQSQYVSDLTKRVYGQGLSAAQVGASVNAWVRKFLEAAYSYGVMQADADGMYEFAGADGAESCATCDRLKGQRHRYSEWFAAKLRPGVDTESFECGGWACRHKLIKVKGKARGRLKEYSGVELTLKVNGSAAHIHSTEKPPQPSPMLQRLQSTGEAVRFALAKMQQGAGKRVRDVALGYDRGGIK